MKIAAKNSTNDNYPYDNLYDLILEYKIFNLKNGLMESSLNKLELYIREIC